jgi:hypothetical protein
MIRANPRISAAKLLPSSVPPCLCGENAPNAPAEKLILTITIFDFRIVFALFILKAMRNIDESNPSDKEPMTFLCPNCSWRASGTDVEALHREKNTHAMFECPLPGAAKVQIPA